MLMNFSVPKLAESLQILSKVSIYMINYSNSACYNLISFEIFIKF